MRGREESLLKMSRVGRLHDEEQVGRPSPTTTHTLLLFVGVVNGGICIKRLDGTLDGAWDQNLPNTDYDEKRRRGVSIEPHVRAGSRTIYVLVGLRLSRKSMLRHGVEGVGLLMCCTNRSSPSDEIMCMYIVIRFLSRWATDDQLFYFLKGFNGLETGSCIYMQDVEGDGGKSC
ncbi:hypothetical protein F4778DRAFT_287152 [Xylariomycetidae sp. FL2044]|nr:hypothetical protein F4778DRAFT_287152 [Xylariomycetidae sp. FL2044]